MSDFHTLILILIMMTVTLALRFLPFLIFGSGRATPKYISYLGDVLPYAIMGMLIVYCLREVSFLTAPFGAPEIAGVLVTSLLHIAKRNTILSIIGGTAVYMILVQTVFV